MRLINVPFGGVNHSRLKAGHVEGNATGEGRLIAALGWVSKRDHSFYPVPTGQVRWRPAGPKPACNVPSDLVIPLSARPPLSRLPSEAFAKFVVESVRRIPIGFVSTYGDIYPPAPRQVGQVLATTEEKLPWHRVVRADGVAPMGPDQLRLLRQEGVPIRGNRVDMNQARWGRMARGVGHARHRDALRCAV